METAFLALAAFQVVSGFQNAQNTKANAQVQQQIAQMNEKYANIDANEQLQASYTKAAEYDSQVQAVVSKQRQTYAAEGVDVSYGTASQVQSQSTLTGQINALQILKQGRQAANGLQMQAINYGLSGDQAKTQGDLNAGAQEDAGLMQGLSTGLSGYAKYSSSTGTGTTSRTGSSSGFSWAGGGDSDSFTGEVG